MIALVTAGAEHASIISELSTETFFETYSPHNTVENMQLHATEFFNNEKTIAELQSSGNVFFIVYVDEIPAGFTKMRTTENPEQLAGKKHIEVERIYILQAFQKQRLGYALIQHCIQFASNNDYEILWLGVWEKNVKALAFYQKNGFEIFGQHSFLLGNDDQTDWLMKMDLNNSKEGEVSRQE